MVYRYDFNIIRPSSRIALGAASLGERMRRNRLAEAMAERQQDFAEDQQRSALEQQSRENQRGALTDYGVGIRAVSEIEDPAMRAEAYRRMRARLGQVWGNEAIDDLPPDLDERMMASHLAELAPYAEQMKPTALQQDLEAAGLEPGTPEYQRRLLEIRSKPDTALTITEADKPLGPDAQKYRDLDNRMPSSTMTPRQAEAAGFELQSPERLEAMKEASKNREMIAFLDEEVEKARGKYESALKSLKSSPSNQTRRDAKNAAADLQTALAGRGNWRGEPSGEVATRYTVPGPIQSLLEEGFALLSGENGNAEELPRRIASDEEYNALPSGTEFIGPDGKRRRKP